MSRWGPGLGVAAALLASNPAQAQTHDVRPDTAAPITIVLYQTDVPEELRDSTLADDVKDMGLHFCVPQQTAVPDSLSGMYFASVRRLTFIEKAFASDEETRKLNNAFRDFVPRSPGDNYSTTASEFFDRYRNPKPPFRIERQSEFDGYCTTFLSQPRYVKKD